MAFPIPEHLPRRPIAQDVSSAILNKISEATNSSLTTQLANQWLTELDESILATKWKIHNTISDNLPEFQRQHASALSVQARLVSLSSNVDTLETSVVAPNTGLIDSVISKLTAHSKLAQEKSDVDALCQAMAYVSHCREMYNTMHHFVLSGQLAPATRAAKELQDIFTSCPNHLANTRVVADLQSKFSVSKARLEDQLDDAYSRSFMVSQSELTVPTTIPVRDSEATTSFGEVANLLPPASLTAKLSILRRDLLRLFDHVLVQPLTISSMDDGINLGSSLQNANSPSMRISNLATVLDFLASHLLPHLPPSFPQTLSRPLTNSLLENVIVPSLASSFHQLPPYLSLTRQTVLLEETYVVQLLGNDPKDTPIKDWVSHVGGHYERQRRTQRLDEGRKLFTHSPQAPFLATVTIQPPELDAQNEIVAIQSDGEHDTHSNIDMNEKDAWGFEDDSPVTSKDGSENTEAWGFDDDIEAVSQEEGSSQGAGGILSKESEPDPDEAWGWNDEDAQDDDAWDDPWAESSQKEPSTKPAQPPPVAAAPKVAKRLEKLALKGKKAEGESSSSVDPLAASLHPSSISPDSSIVVSPSPPQIKVRPAELAPSNSHPVTETYLVSGAMSSVVNMLTETLQEAAELSSEGPQALGPTTSSPPGTILYQTANSLLDLFRAIRPRGQAKPIEALQFSNDCLWLSEELGKNFDSDRFPGVIEKMKMVSERVYRDTIAGQSRAMQKLLADGAKGFANTTDSERYDECEAAVHGCVQAIKKSAQQWKGLLAKGRYYAAIGLIVDASLSKVLRDVLSLHDIPEVESNRIGELCRIFNSLEGLFVENTEQPSFVVAYVPSWLKFSYLSELLEASMADITYLFEEGALVDFETEELVRLVKALFADNALRTTTLNKLTAGQHAQ